MFSSEGTGVGWRLCRECVVGFGCVEIMLSNEAVEP